jgi:competence protein ComEC
MACPPHDGPQAAPGRWLAAHPLCAAAVAVLAAVVAADFHPAAGGSVVVLAAALGWWWSSWKCGLAWFACGAVAVTMCLTRSSARHAAEAALLAAGTGHAQARLLEDAEGNSYHWSAPARLVAGPWSGTRVMWEGGGSPPVAGALVAATGGFEPLPEPRNPGEFDRAAWLRRQGVAAVFRTSGVPDKTITPWWAARGAQIRQGFRDRVTAGLDPTSEAAVVIRAVVIGETPADADALIAAFRNSGTLHVFSVSGLHVAMVGGIGWILLAALGVGRRPAVTLLLPLVFGYAWITGNSAPAVRSAWMAAVFLGAFWFRRKPDLLNALGAVLLAAMLWDGRLVFQPGVQLSYGVVAAIALGTPLAGRAFAWMARPEPYLPTSQLGTWRSRWLDGRRSLAKSLAVSLAAGIGSAPLTWFHFGLVTPVSLIAGLVLLPLVFVLLAASLLAVALSPLAPPAARGINRINAAVASLCVRSAEAFAAIPGGHVQHRPPSPSGLLVYDLGHGAAATCFSGGAGEGAVLFDCGGRQSFRRCVAPSLRKLGIEPDSVVLSHPDGHHLGGAAAVWQAFPIRQAVMPVASALSPAQRQWLRDAPRAGVGLFQASVLASLRLPDGAVLEVVHAPDPLALHALADERVALYRLHWRGWRILFTADAGMGTELRALDAGREVAADVIIAGRHRGDLTLCDRFLTAVSPRAIIASNQRFPAGEQLPEATKKYWKSRGIKVLDQAELGAVWLRPGPDDSLVIEGFLGGGAPVVLQAR